MELDPVFLSCLQFALVICFHIIFPSFTIGLAAWLATLRGHNLPESGFWNVFSKSA
jgi:cytochrome d ubiquinol oxidase subunit I